MRIMWTFILLPFSLFCFSQELNDALNEWLKHPFIKENATGTSITLNKKALEKVVAFGPRILPELFIKAKQSSSKAALMTAASYILKNRFEIRTDDLTKRNHSTDYPDCPAWPIEFRDEKEYASTLSIWEYWWNKGRALTPEIFKRKYDAYIKAKTDKNDEEIKKTYILLQNMGIIILPDLLEKIESGESDLIPMFSYLTNDKVAKDATAEDCKKFWDENKSDYAIILDYQKKQ